MMITLRRCKIGSFFNRKTKTSLKGRSYATESLEAKYYNYGNPQSVLKLEKSSIPKVSSDSVLVEMLAAPINHGDWNRIEGNYPVDQPLPAVGGADGVGRVQEVGPNVKNLKVGDIVVLANRNLGSWRTHTVSKESDFLAIDPKGLKYEYLACLNHLSTAHRLLEDFENLKEGDVIIQNAANSMIGLSVVQLAHERGIKTINILRTGPHYDDLVEHIKTYGGYVVDSYQYLSSQSFKRLISDLPKPKLALNGVGGSTVHELAKTLDNNATIVTYGSVSKKPIPMASSPFIFNNLSMRGFWLDRWLATHSIEERKAMYDSLLSKCASKSLKIWTESHEFNNDSFETALERSVKEFKLRKVVLDFQSTNSH